MFGRKKNKDEKQKKRHRPGMTQDELSKLEEVGIKRGFFSKKPAKKDEQIQKRDISRPLSLYTSGEGPSEQTPRASVLQRATIYGDVLPRRTSPPSSPPLSPPPPPLLKHHTEGNMKFPVPPYRRRVSGQLSTTTPYDSPRKQVPDGYSVPRQVVPPEETRPVIFAPAVKPKPKRRNSRTVVLKKREVGGFGVSLRRSTVVEVVDGGEVPRTVYFAEPGTSMLESGGQDDPSSRLFPGDRLLEVNGMGVEQATRDDIISRIRNSGSSVTLVVLGEEKEVDGKQSLPRTNQTNTGSVNQVQAKDDKSPKLPAVKKESDGSSNHVETNGGDMGDVVDVGLMEGVGWERKERVWLKHNDGISRAHVVTPDKSSEDVPVLPDGKCWVELEATKKVVSVAEEDVDLANEASYDRSGDISTLRHLNESSILHTLSSRYFGGLVYTFAGPHLVTIAQDQSNPSNYSSQVKSTYKGSRFGDTPPHIYAVAQHAHQDMMASNGDQCIITLGHSNAGKSCNIRHMVVYYAGVATSASSPTVEKVTSAMDVMSSFTTTTTHQCKEATRCVFIYSVDFDRTGQMSALSVQALLLERSRVVHKPPGETNFHIFYQLLYGADPQLRRELFLLDVEQADNPLIHVNEEPNFQQNALKGFAHLQKAFDHLGLSSEERKSIFHILAACLHLGVAGVQKVNGSRYQFAKADSAQKAASLLGVPAERLSKWIFQPSSSGKKNRSLSSASLKRSTSLSAHSLQSLPQVTEMRQSGEQQLNGFIISLYVEVFRTVVSFVNRSLSSSHRSQHSILIIDTPGYQGSSGGHQGSSGGHEGSDDGRCASYYDLTYNYVQDRLHAHYHGNAFTSHRDRYLQEDIDCDVIVPDCDFTRSIDVIGQPPSVGGGKGLLWLLDEEAGMEGATDESFVDRLLLQHQHQPKHTRSVVKRSEHGTHIHIHHQGGLHSVEYDASGWLDHARFNSTNSSAAQVLQESKKKYISELFGGSGGERLHGSISGLKLDGGAANMKRSSSFKKSWGASVGAMVVKKSLCMLAKFQTDGLVDMLRRTQPHFILAVTPNLPHEARGTPNIPIIRHQIQGFQLVDVARMHKQGYPEHMVFYEFRRHFDVLLRQIASNLPSNSTSVSMLDDREATEHIVKFVELERSQYRLGNTQIFFRSGSLNALEDRRNAKVADVIIAFQARCRGYIARKKLERKKVQVVAVRCIQRNVRLFMAIRQWPWWKLLTKVLPLVEVTRTEEELREKQAEFEILKEKFDKISLERDELQTSNTKFEKKLSDTLLHLEEEQATATHAAEVLQHEMKERVRLERIVKDNQGKYEEQQKKVEQMEVELAEKRLLFADHQPIDSDDELEDGEYKAKYERAVREFQFEMKKKAQIHEDALEEREAEKKSLERKMSQLHEELEERDRTGIQHRKKLQRLTAQLSDAQIHLEETTSKNHELERKQRKFDSELYAVQADVTGLKTSRDRIQREKDKMMMENNQLEKQLEEKCDEIDDMMSKISRLEAELEDNSMRDTDDRQLVNGLRKKIRELEGKMQEQEEELEDQASSIHTLEQTKERLEMSSEQTRNQRQREVEMKEEELEEMRSSYQKRIKNLEMQLEEAEEERSSTSKHRRELEDELAELRGSPHAGHDVEMERRLRKDLKRYKALLADAQTLIDHLKVDAVSKQQTKQLKGQLEDAQYACSAAVKSRKAIELEQEDLQAQLEEATRGKLDAESRLSVLKREVHELQSKLDEDEEESQETLRKYKSLVAHQSEDRRMLVEAQGTIEELKHEKAINEDKIVALQSQIEYMESSMVDNATASRHEAKAKDFETKLEFQKTTCRRLEVQLARLKDNVDKVSAERDSHVTSEVREKEALKRVQRQLRESKAEQGELLKREQDALQKKHDLEMELSDRQNQIEGLQSDLKLAFKRISNLQIAFEELDESGDESLTSSDEEELRASRSSWRSRSGRPSVLSSRSSFSEDDSAFRATKLSEEYS